MACVLHFVRDHEDPYSVVGAFREAMVPGSYLALSHATTDGPPPDLIAGSEEVYKGPTSPAAPRSQVQIRHFFDGFELVAPGLARPWQWRPDHEHGPQTELQYAGVGKKSG
jgi:hypothetical protein